MRIVVLTATYNRSEKLELLFKSLLSQTNQSFRWIIIDDGSKDKTHEVVSSWSNVHHLFQIDYYYKNNSGKSKSINMGLGMLADDEFVAIIDDDEQLYPFAIETLESYSNQYANSDCAGMEFLRDCDGKPISNYRIDKDFFMSVQERKKRKLEIDGYACYYAKYVKEHRFPEYEGEKYVGPGVLQMICSADHKLLWPSKSLGYSTYLDGGITSQGRVLRLKNPKGMIKYCSLLQTKQSGVKVRIKYSIMGYAYIFVSKLKKADLAKEKLSKHNFLKICLIPGFVLSLFWRKKLDKKTR